MANGHDDVPPPDHADPETSRHFVTRISQGDTAAFEQLYTTLYPELLRAAVRLLHSRELAEEVVQDVFVWVWSHRNQWTVRTTVRAYLHGAVRYRAATVIRAEMISQDIEDGDDEDAAGHSEPQLQPDEMVDTTDLQGAILTAIRTLPDRQREAVILWARHQMSMVELGEALGISHVAARKLLLKAQAKLQAVIDLSEHS
ncbi:MAG TPA: sigma-70 family RNA polymerase sigma factor [Gemmatimonadaceae bacterium]|jgi:RNA polymerase sigma factor (sigma-70 family)|nr:sigma-70 family RNA polymerase sigma factor [Gemmatimonadaceae bacterium]